ncbi:MAG: hypothetical protein AAB341_05100 [Planctomycetota bacterium]
MTIGRWNRRRAWVYAIRVLPALSLGGCDALTILIQPTTVTVLLVNNGSFPVDVDLFHSDVQDVPEFLLTEVGTEVNLTVEAGQTRTIVRDCDALQAIVIDNAELRVLGGIGPEANTDVLRDGGDFGCGDVITFTFSHTAAIVDFDVSTTVR